MRDVGHQTPQEFAVVSLYDTFAKSFHWARVTVVCKSCKQPFRAGHLCPREA